MKRIKLHLTGVSDVITEAAEKKLETEEDYQIPTCANGLTEEQYIDFGIPLPSDLVQKIKNQEKGVDFKDEDFEEVYSRVSVYEDLIKLAVTDEDGTTLFFNDGFTVTVLESVDDIDDYIEYTRRNWFEKIRDYILFFFAEKFKK